MKILSICLVKISLILLFFIEAPEVRTQRFRIDHLTSMLKMNTKNLNINFPFLRNSQTLGTNIKKKFPVDLFFAIEDTTIKFLMKEAERTRQYRKKDSLAKVLTQIQTQQMLSTTMDRKDIGECFHGVGFTSSSSGSMKTVLYQIPEKAYFIKFEDDLFSKGYDLKEEYSTGGFLVRMYEKGKFRVSTILNLPKKVEDKGQCFRVYVELAK